MALDGQTDDWSAVAAPVEPTPPADDWSGVVAPPTQTPDASQAKAAALVAPPLAQATKARQVGKQLNLDPSFVAQDAQGWSDIAEKQQRLDAADHPAIQALLEKDPLAAAYLGPDAGLMKGIAELYGSFAGGTRQAYGQTDVGRAASGLALQRQLGDTVGAADTDVRIKAMEEGLKGLSNGEPPDQSFISMAKIGSLIGMLASNAASGMPKGAAAGALAGLAVAGPVGAVAGGLTGAGVGMTTDFLYSNFGSLYRASDLYRDPQGRELPESAKVAGALLGTSLVGAATAAAGPIGGRLVSPMLAAVLPKMVAETSVQGVITGAMASLAKAGLGGGTLMAAITGGNAVGEDLSKSMAGLDLPTMFNNPGRRAEVAADIGHEFVSGLLTFGALASLPIGVHAGLDTARIYQTRADVAQRNAAFAQAVDLKARQDAPEVVEKFFDGLKLPDTVVPVETVKEQLAKDPNAFHYVDGLAAKIADAESRGGDIAIPTGKYFAYTDPAVHEAIKDQIRGPNGLTGEQAEALTTRDPIRDAPEVKNEEGEVLSVPTPEPQEPGKTPEEQTIIDSVDNLTKTAQKALWLDPVITPQAAGMSKAIFAKYSKAIQEQQKAVTKAVFDAAAAEIKRLESPRYKAELALTADEVRSDYEKEPRYIADSYLREGKLPDGREQPRVKLSADDINDLFSAEEQKEMGGTPSDLVHKSIVSDTDAMNPDALANFTGHNSGREMVEDLIALEHDRRMQKESPREQFIRQIKDEATARVRNRYGDLSSRILDQAVDAAMSVKQLEVLAQDIENSARQIGAVDFKVDLDAVKAKVLDVHGRMDLKDSTNAKAFDRAVAQYGKETRDALLAGKYDEAFVAEQKQLENILHAKEARRLAKEFGDDRVQLPKNPNDPFEIPDPKTELSPEEQAKRAEAREARKLRAAPLTETISRLQKNRFDPAIDQAHVDQLHALLIELGLAVPRSSENVLAAVTKPDGTVIHLNDFADSRKAELGEDIIPLPHTGKKFTEMNAEELQDLKKTVDSMVFAGKVSKMVTLGEETSARNEVISRILDNLDSMSEKYHAESVDGKDWSALQGLKTPGRWVDAKLLHMEQLALWLDKRDPLGPMSRLFQSIKAAEHAKTMTMKDIVQQYRDLPGSNKWKKSLDQEVPNNLLMDEKGEPMRLRREHVLMMALNMGAEGNYKNLVEGRGWDYQTFESFIHDKKIMRPEDWAFVQGVWKITDGLWPLVKDAGERRTGVVPEAVKTRAVDTAYGRIPGGYFPLIKDTLKDPVTLQGETYARGQLNPVVAAASMTQGRTGMVYPVSLIFDRLAGRIEELVHDVHFAEPVANAAKVFSDPNVQEAVTAKFGPEYAGLLMPWLDNAANNGRRASDNPFKALTPFSQALRDRFIHNMIWLRPGTALIHGGSAASTSSAEIPGFPVANLIKAYMDSARSPEALLGEVNMMFKNPEGYATMWNWARSQSMELQNRMHNLDANVREAMERSFRDPGSVASSASFMKNTMNLVALTDYASTVPVWVALYKQAVLEKGLNHADAVQVADQAVRNAHGSSGLVDTPEVQRAGELAKWGTMFYGFFSHNYNRNRDTARVILDPEMSVGDKAQVVAKRTAMYFVVPALIHYLVRSSSEDHDPWYKQGAIALGAQAAGDVPGLRSAYQAWETNRRSPSFFNTMDELGARLITDPIRDIHSMVDPARKAQEHKVKDALNLLSITTGLGSDYTSGIGQFLYDRVTHAPTAAQNPDWKRLILDGNPAPRKAH